MTGKQKEYAKEKLVIEVFDEVRELCKDELQIAKGFIWGLKARGDKIPKEEQSESEVIASL
ncbi:hypothetical protein IIU_05062 [Bacillus cereus VD133]|uniref:Uncharacterized protein n=1 Tax=Bacillus cereus VD133 TaxID=1053233 RepID=A0A9W5V0S5_BACCE|nr:MULTISPECIES: hypothetical protein [Bacillus cereus group]EOO30745.1 hypothetical protein IIU_05062 [Bacillus cereus VD133]